MWGAFGQPLRWTIPRVPPALTVEAAESCSHLKRKPSVNSATDFDPKTQDLAVCTPCTASSLKLRLGYVAARGGKRVAGFPTDVKYMTQVCIYRWCLGSLEAGAITQTDARVSFSADPGSGFLSRQQDRNVSGSRPKDLASPDSLGRPGMRLASSTRSITYHR